MKDINERNELGLDKNGREREGVSSERYIKGDLFGVGKRTLAEISGLKTREIFCVSFHTGKIIQRFVRLAMDSGVNSGEIERVISEAYVSSEGVVRFLQNYMWRGRK